MHAVKRIELPGCSDTVSSRRVYILECALKYTSPWASFLSKMKLLTLPSSALDTIANMTQTINTTKNSTTLKSTKQARQKLGSQQQPYPSSPDSPGYGSPSAGFRRILPDAVDLSWIHLKATNVCRFPNSNPNTHKPEDRKREGLLRYAFIGIPVLGQ